MSTNINLIRRGAITTPSTPGTARRVVQIVEIYPYHRCRYPDRVDFDHCTSNERCPAPFDKLLEQILLALELHVSMLSFLSSFLLFRSGVGGSVLGSVWSLPLRSEFLKPASASCPTITKSTTGFARIFLYKFR
jgi:hypothetical protein